MRIRTFVSAATAAVLVTGLTAAPATAGTGASTYCTDGSAYREIPILTSPVTVTAEVFRTPGGNEQLVLICYSTTPPGQPGTVTGGALAVHVLTDTSTAFPGAYVGLGCYPDYATGVGPACTVGNSANVGTGSAVVTTPPSSICLVSLGSGCVAYVPGVKVSDNDPRPLLAIHVLSVPLAVQPPQQCIAVVVTCP